MAVLHLLTHDSNWIMSQHKSAVILLGCGNRNSVLFGRKIIALDVFLHTVFKETSTSGVKCQRTNTERNNNRMENFIQPRLELKPCIVWGCREKQLSSKPDQNFPGAGKLYEIWMKCPGGSICKSRAESKGWGIPKCMYTLSFFCISLELNLMNRKAFEAQLALHCYQWSKMKSFSKKTTVQESTVKTKAKGLEFEAFLFSKCFYCHCILSACSSSG